MLFIYTSGQNNSREQIKMSQKSAKRLFLTGEKKSRLRKGGAKIR